MNEKEKRVKEERLIEATQKGFTGLEGKFGTILKSLGQPILSHFEMTEFADPYELLEEKESIISSPSLCNIREIGLHFDGLSRGMHLEIRYDPEEQKLIVSYKGYLVYCEIMGDLEIYVPSSEWESKINSLYVLAKKKENAAYQQQVEESKEDARQSKLSLLERLRLRWGI